MIALIFAAGLSLAADLDLVLETGSKAQNDARLAIAGARDGMGTLGGHVDLKLQEHLAVRVSFASVNSERSLELDGENPALAWNSQTLAAGIVYRGPGLDWVHPTVALEGGLVGARLRIDDEPGNRVNKGQLGSIGFAPAVSGLGGVRLTTVGDSRVHLVGTLEVGYAWTGDVDLDAFGAVHPRGAVFRTGIGIRL